MRLWDWALAAYARPGVADACLSLQDYHRQNVPLLLAAAWAADEGRTLDLDGAAGLAAAWDDRAVLALRAARRGVQAALPGIDDASREALRTTIKAVELSAERLLLDALERLAGPVGSAGSGPQAALGRAAEAFAHRRAITAPPHAAVDQLSALF